jgi:hypothetical protein
MKHRLILGICLLFLGASDIFAQIHSSEALVRAMRQRYDGKWYSSLTFIQNTITHLPNGSTKEQTWFEAMKCPGKLRIALDSLSSPNGIVFRSDSLYQIRNSNVAGKRAMVHILLVTGFDVYFLSAEETLRKLAGEKIDLQKFSTNTWQNRPVYVMGAAANDSTSAQVWVDQEHLYTVRILQPSPNNALVEYQFNGYERIGNAWISPEMVFKTNGKVFQEEQYADIHINQNLPDALFDPKKWKQVYTW